MFSRRPNTVLEKPQGTIVLDNVWKRYRREDTQLHRSMTRWMRGERAPDAFWALSGITATITPGEAVGIVGPNAAGKSTILKIIAGITEPTSGTAEAHGHIGSLIELGAGFHPELTGRENLLLLGTLLGHSRSELRDRLPEIIDFADIGPFLDMPLKRYSSGMQVRLSFAVAVSSEPEILLIDEALAVGDAAFQEKCLEQFGAFQRSGVTIVLVSHSTDLIAKASTRTLWINQGSVYADGPTDIVLHAYAEATRSTAPQHSHAPAL